MNKKNDWIRSIRQKAGVQGLQLAERMGVSPARISVMERDEQRGAVTLKMMKRAADALDCEFVYSLIPSSEYQELQHLLETYPVDKPKIRIDSAHFQESREYQLYALQQEYERKLSKEK